jgi:hypothetical protein
MKEHDKGGMKAIKESKEDEDTKETICALFVGYFNVWLHDIRSIVIPVS